MITIELNKAIQTGYAFNVMEGDKGSVVVRGILPSEGDGVDLSSATWAVLYKNGTNKSSDTVTATKDTSTGILSMEWTVPANAAATAGKMEFMFKATSSTTLVWQSGIYTARVDAALDIS